MFFTTVCVFLYPFYCSRSSPFISYSLLCSGQTFSFVFRSFLEKSVFRLKLICTFCLTSFIFKANISIFPLVSLPKQHRFYETHSSHFSSLSWSSSIHFSWNSRCTLPLHCYCCQVLFCFFILLFIAFILVISIVFLLFYIIASFARTHERCQLAILFLHLLFLNNFDSLFHA